MLADIKDILAIVGLSSIAFLIVYSIGTLFSFISNIVNSHIAEIQQERITQFVIKMTDENKNMTLKEFRYKLLDKGYVDEISKIKLPVETYSYLSK